MKELSLPKEATSYRSCLLRLFYNKAKWLNYKKYVFFNLVKYMPVYFGHFTNIINFASMMILLWLYISEKIIKYKTTKIILTNRV